MYKDRYVYCRLRYDIYRLIFYHEILNLTEEIIMNQKTKKIISAVATVVLFIGLGIYYLMSSTSGEETTEATAEPTTEVSVETVSYEFRKQQYLDEHVAKHGSEFDYETADEYLAGANRVINDPNSLYKTEAEDGDHIYYLESTNEFVVVSTDGYIRTYFRPSAGIDYFNRQ